MYFTADGISANEHSANLRPALRGVSGWGFGVSGLLPGSHASDRLLGLSLTYSRAPTCSSVAFRVTFTPHTHVCIVPSVAPLKGRISMDPSMFGPQLAKCIPYSGDA